MNDFHATLDFVVREGTLLALLFFGIAFVVALLQQGVGDRLNAALGRTSLGTGSVLAATAGAVTPFCSCSTIPVLSGMLRARVRFGVCFTFLIASPVINEGVLLVLLKEFSLAISALFLLVAAALSVAFGVGVDRAGLGRFVRSAVPAAGPALDGAVQVGAGGDGACPASVPWPTRVRFALTTARSELRGAAPYLAAGVAVGGLIYGYLPQDAIAALQHRFPGLALTVVMAVVGLPFYVNSTMVIPIAVALLAKGVSIGPVAAFLVSAAGTSIPEMILLTKLFRAPLVLSHVIAIVVSATVIGVVLEAAARFI